MFDSEDLCPFNEISTLISGLLKPLTLVQGKYGRKNKKKKKKKNMEQNAYYHKILCKFPSSLKKHYMRFKSFQLFKRLFKKYGIAIH